MSGIVRGLVGAAQGVVAVPTGWALGALGEDNVLEHATNVFRKATQSAILKFVSAVIRTILSAMTGYLGGPVGSIWRFVLDNPVNAETLNFVLDNWALVAYFLLDLLEATKRFARADDANGEPGPDDEQYNRYNELDLYRPMNRHAVVSQVQRLFVSIIELLKQNDRDITKFEMDTELASDTNKAASIVTGLKRKDQEDETWLFINGIAGEYYWNTLAVEKIRDHFFDPDDSPADQSEEARRTQIEGIFNRSDGMLWDLIECGSERRSQGASDDPPSPMQRTKSSKTAQNELSVELRKALEDPRERQIIMIAHSQGCLLLRLALGDLADPKNARLHDAMRSRLQVYTFGNPAYDWDVHAFCARTEHFANKADFVAVLGVLRTYKEPGKGSEGLGTVGPYCSLCRDGDEKHNVENPQLIWINNKGRRGHLFGSQYSLAEEDYSCVNLIAGKTTLLNRAERRVRRGDVTGSDGATGDETDGEGSNVARGEASGAGRARL